MDTSKEKNMPCNEKNSVKEVARRILKMDGNTLTLSLGFLICLVLCILPLVLSSAVSYLVPPESPLFGLCQLVGIMIMFGGLVFVSLPSVAGYQTLAKDIVNGEKRNVLDLFSICKNAKKYFRGMLLSLLSILYVLFIVFVFVGGIVQLRASAEALVIVGPIEIVSLISFWLCTVVAAVTVLAYISSYLFFVPYLYLNGTKFKDALRMSFVESKSCRAQIIKQEFLYLLYLLLGIITLGVVLVIRSAPKISVSYFVFGNRVFNKTSCEA